MRGMTATPTVENDSRTRLTASRAGLGNLCCSELCALSHNKAGPGSKLVLQLL